MQTKGIMESDIYTKKKIHKIICVILAGAIIVTSTGIVGAADANSKSKALKVEWKKIVVTAGRSIKVGYKATGKVKAISSKNKVARVSVKKKIVIKGIKKEKQ